MKLNQKSISIKMVKLFSLLHLRMWAEKFDIQFPECDVSFVSFLSVVI